jgi:transposase
MPRIAEAPSHTEEDLHTLMAWSKSRTIQARMVERAKIILKSIGGQTDSSIAAELNLRPNTVGLWRRRFIEHGLDGLFDRPRSGKPEKYDPVETRKAVLELLETPPPKGQAKWDGKAVAERLNISDDKVWRILRKEGISLQRRRS